jgi:NAD(P)-dependent dehydrogenase (short-subunit alcohol dehydrogenase family)
MSTSSRRRVRATHCRQSSMVAGARAASPAICRKPMRRANLVDAAMQAFGRIDVVVNNAGATPRGDFLAFDDAAWAEGFALKFFGAVRLCRAAWPHLVAQRKAAS